MANMSFRNAGIEQKQRIYMDLDGNSCGPSPKLSRPLKSKSKWSTCSILNDSKEPEDGDHPTYFDPFGKFGVDPAFLLELRLEY